MAKFSFDHDFKGRAIVIATIGICAILLALFNPTNKTKINSSPMQLLQMTTTTTVSHGIPPSIHDFLEKVSAASVLLYFQDERGGMTYACGATAIHHIENYYFFATAAHCFSNNGTAYITSDSTVRKDFVPVFSAICGNPQKGEDVCVLAVATTENFPVIELGEDPKTFGEEVYNVAVPNGVGRQVLRGSVTTARLERPLRSGPVTWRNDFVAQIPGTMGGSSGSAIICETQQAICGIVSGVMLNGTQITPLVMIVPVSVLKKLIMSF